MLTRCPECDTRFRVTAEQLKARAGRVRCGECQHVFNALDSLVETPIPPAAQAAAEPSRPPLAILEAGPQAEAARIIEADDHAAVSPAPTFEPMLATPHTDFPVPAETDETSPGEPAAEPGAPVAPTDADAGGWNEEFPESPRAPRRWPWILGSLAALAALAAQAALAFRVELAVLSPEAKPALVALCEIADCEVGLPAKAALVGIEGSDLYPEKGLVGRLSLTATLKNRAPFAQQFPHLELTLTDVADKAVARRVMKPQDYLPPRTTVAEGMPPNADIAVVVAIDTGEIQASGYRLYLFYP